MKPSSLTCYQLRFQGETHGGKPVNLHSTDISLEKPDADIAHRFVLFARTALEEVHGPLNGETVKVDVIKMELYFKEPKTLVAALADKYFSTAHSFVHSVARWLQVPVKDVSNG